MDTGVAVHIPKEIIANECPREYLKLELTLKELPDMDNSVLGLWLNYGDSDAFIDTEFNADQINLIKESSLFEDYRSLIAAFNIKTGVTINCFGYAYKAQAALYDDRDMPLPETHSGIYWAADLELSEKLEKLNARAFLYEY